ncbi:unnamed protein product [Rhizophagus irregularis]|nr:unnamed protein product [Rhizophagus irregularis]
MCKTIGMAWTLHSYRRVGLCFIFVLKKLIYTRLECSIPDENKQIRLLDFLDFLDSLDSALENFLYNWTFLTQL